MKKLLAVLLCLIMVLSMASCGSSGSDKEATGSTSGSGQEAAGSGGSAETAETAETSDIDWPTKPIEVIIPFGAGGDSDAYLRALTPELSKILGVDVIVTNMSGESLGAISEYLKRDADGYTVFYYNTSLNATEAAGKYGDISLINDMVPAGVIASDENTGLFVRADSGITNFEQFLTAAADPSFKFANGTQNVEAYLSSELAKQTGVDFHYVAQASDSSGRTLQLLSGEVDAIYSTYGNFTDYIAQGEVVCVGLLSDHRNPNLPDVPTLAEQMEGVSVTNPKRYLFRMKAGVDQAIVDKFADAVKEAVGTGCLDSVAEMYFAEVSYMSPADQQAFETERVEGMKAAFAEE